MNTENLNCHEVKSDKRPQLGLWTPGDYFNKCTKCTGLFIGDKRARMCADCAYDLKESNDEIKFVELQDVKINEDDMNSSATSYVGKYRRKNEY
jgi:hypothetical protein